jgi:hypothetical protein
MTRGMRVHAALTALAFVLSSLIGMVHEATTKHVRCAEHGELVHAASTTTTTTAATISADAASAVRDAPAAAIHGHDHCSLTSTTRDSRVELRPLAVTAARVAISDVATALPRPIAARGARLYRTAPKTSPPA